MEALPTKRSAMIYQVVARRTGEQLDLHAIDWWNLLGLAFRYGWRPGEGLDHYLYDASYISGTVSQDIAEALLSAVPRLPEEEGPRVYIKRSSLTAITDPMPKGPYEDSQNHFGGKRRWLVGEFARLCQKGILDIHKLT